MVAPTKQPPQTRHNRCTVVSFANVYQKLQVHSKTEAVAKALRKPRQSNTKHWQLTLMILLTLDFQIDSYAACPSLLDSRIEIEGAS